MANQGDNQGDGKGRAQKHWPSQRKAAASVEPTQDAKRNEPQPPRQRAAEGLPTPPRNYRKYRGLPKSLKPGDDGLAEVSGLASREKGSKGRGGGTRFTWKRAVIGVVCAVFGWLLLSLILFLVSAGIQSQSVPDAAKEALSPSGYTLTSPNTILVLGSDQRSKSTAEPGASTTGPSRSDSIMLLRVGGGKAARLSIPRDTVVDIPGHGPDKINAAYAIGGAALTITTLEQYLGIEINHLIEVDFENFPDFIDALGGIDVETGCIRAKINGGYSNGGVTIRVKKGTNHFDGKRALALARIRSNDCRPGENAIDRDKRQQKIMAAIKSQLLSVGTFFRLPWVAWQAPKAIRSDMGGFDLLGVFGSIVFNGEGETRVLLPTGAETLPDGGAGLTVSDARKRREVRRFEKG